MNQHPAAPRRRRRGCVILAAVFLLVGFWAWTGFTKLKRQAQRGSCLMNISQLAKAMRLYSLDYNGYIFFDHADAFSPPLVRGRYGQTRYLIEAMRRYLPHWGIWYCPSDPFAPPDAMTSPPSIDALRPYRTFTYHKSGIGYVAVPHAESDDPGIRALHERLVRHYGVDTMRMDHAWSSYRFIPFHDEKTEGRPVYIDGIMRAYDDRWGHYGYWDINPDVAPVFEEDLSFHFTSGGLFHDRIYGRTFGFRDGHAVFHTYENQGVNIYGELIEVF